MKDKLTQGRYVSRRNFAAALTSLAGAGAMLADQANPPAAQPSQNANTSAQNTSTPARRSIPPEAPPFGESLEFRRKPVEPKVQTFPMTDVRLLPGVFKTCQDANLGYLKRLDSDRDRKST